jgi:adenylosuccinate synthase
MRYAHTVSGFDTLAITKLDVLDKLPEIPVCTSYKYRGSRWKGFPGDAQLLQCCEAVYELRRGWQTSTSGLRQFEQLPQTAQDYLKYLEDQVEAEISIISTGADREDTILRMDRPGLARLLSK